MSRVCKCSFTGTLLSYMIGLCQNRTDLSCCSVSPPEYE
nr:MAG TPA: hypothetical protein [Caudoviricetes sp.]